ncbi:hypothetical protein LC653_41900 [Nostoc sp. CHAB 5784]|uniref:hypothetical protein n=1 Tax=Nostoc mirabile TaxID=2907820 RepID=UPI001E47DC60|nr:hypothetical protein [Nostoc mirabile]MCC5670175.1 hypothetical protein [Nostoc mirabile CHAB5784]
MTVLDSQAISGASLHLPKASDQNHTEKNVAIASVNPLIECAFVYLPFHCYSSLECNTLGVPDILPTFL